MRSKVTSHSVGLVDATISPDGAVTFSLPQYYLWKEVRSRRHIMMSGKGEMVSETIQSALHRKIAESPGSAKLELLEREPFYMILIQDKAVPNGMHAKMFFFVHVTGDRRQVSRVYGEEELGQMVDMEAETLIKAMEVERTVPLHLEVTKMALAAQAMKQVAVYHRYASLLHKFNPPRGLTESDRAILQAYEKWF